MYDRKVIRRRRAVLLLLVGCSLILLTASFGDGLRSVERGALEVFGPIQEGASKVLKPARDAASWVSDTFDAKGENEDLKKERDELRRQIVDARAALAENARLRALVEMDRRIGLQDQGAVTARVISQSPTLWYATVMVDKGTNDGVSEGDPVVDGSGLVGRVRRVGARESQIVLITDSGSAVSAKVNESRASGIVRTAVGDPNDLRLDYLGRNQEARKNQTVVTAGRISERVQPRFPADIPIGRDDDVDEDEGTIHVRPFADLDDLELVQILTEPAL